MTDGIAAPGLFARPYFHRYTNDATDLCDVLSSFNSQAKATLHEICRLMGLPGKPSTISGAEAEKYFRDGQMRNSELLAPQTDGPARDVESRSDVLLKDTVRFQLAQKIWIGAAIDAAGKIVFFAPSVDCPTTNAKDRGGG